MGIGLVVTALIGRSGAETTKDPFDAMGVHRPLEAAPAPDVAFRTLDGHEVRVRHLRGKVVLLGLFTTS